MPVVSQSFPLLSNTSAAPASSTHRARDAMLLHHNIYNPMNDPEAHQQHKQINHKIAHT